VRFLVDANLPPRLSAWLGSRGHECAHVNDLGLADASDTVIWDHARRSGAAIISKDEDFASRARAEGGGPPVVWLRTGNASVAHLMQTCAAAFPVVETRLAAGDALVEVRRESIRE
jgi:predicted nuclease of predicted toxin-antitoxin system